MDNSTGEEYDHGKTLLISNIHNMSLQPLEQHITVFIKPLLQESAAIWKGMEPNEFLAHLEIVTLVAQGDS